MCLAKKKKQIGESSTVHQVKGKVRGSGTVLRVETHDGESSSVPHVKKQGEGSKIVQGVKKQHVVVTSTVQQVKSQDGASSLLQQAHLQIPLVSQPSVTLGASRGFLNALIEASKWEINQQGNVSGEAMGVHSQIVAQKQAPVSAKSKLGEKES